VGGDVQDDLCSRMLLARRILTSVLAGLGMRAMQMTGSSHKFIERAILSLISSKNTKFSDFSLQAEMIINWNVLFLR